MAVSSTYTAALTTASLFDEAFERCGIPTDKVEARMYSAAIRSVMMLFSDWSNDGINLWKVSFTSQTLTAGTASYALPSGCIDVLEMTRRTNAGNVSTQSDILMQAASRAEYMSYPNKLQTGAPTIYTVLRTIAPTFVTWPVADSVETYIAYYSYWQQQADFGSTATPATENPDIPFRWAEAISAGLAARIAVKYATDRVQLLKGEYAESYMRAKREDRERVPLSILPDMSQWGSL